MGYPRPRIVMSMCLGISPVRYNGSIVYDNFVETLKRYVDVQPFCPEVAVGLGVPRNPVVLCDEGGDIRLVDSKTGIDLTERFADTVSRFIESLNFVDGFLLKSASPSCGVGDAKVYGRDRRVIRRSDGLLTLLARSVQPFLPVESERRLMNYSIRRSYLIKVFSLAFLREALCSLTSKDGIADIHRKLKYVIMLYSPSHLRILGQLVAKRKGYEVEELRESYSRLFKEAIAHTPSRGSYANVFSHIYRHVKDLMTQEERRYVNTLLMNYRLGREPLRTIVVYFRGLLHRFGNRYIAEQVFVDPFPEELDHIFVTDGG